MLGNTTVQAVAAELRAIAAEASGGSARADVGSLNSDTQQQASVDIPVAALPPQVAATASSPPGAFTSTGKVAPPPLNTATKVNASSAGDEGREVATTTSSPPGAFTSTGKADTSQGAASDSSARQFSEFLVEKGSQRGNTTVQAVAAELRAIAAEASSGSARADVGSLNSDTQQQASVDIPVAALPPQVAATALSPPGAFTSTGKVAPPPLNTATKVDASSAGDEGREVATTTSSPPGAFTSTGKVAPPPLNTATKVNASSAGDEGREVATTTSSPPGAFTSTGKVAPFYGDLAVKETNVEQMMKARSYKGELIAFWQECCNYLGTTMYLLENLRKHGFEHFVAVSKDQAQCDKFRAQVHQNISCVWQSKKETAEDPFKLLDAALFTRHYFVWKFLEAGVNLLWLDIDIHLPQDPYRYLKGPMRAHLMIQRHTSLELNTGIMYAQNVTPGGPVSAVFKETFERIKWAEEVKKEYVDIQKLKFDFLIPESLKFKRESLPEGAKFSKGANFEQNAITDALESRLGDCVRVWRRQLNVQPNLADFENPLTRSMNALSNALNDHGSDSLVSLKCSGTVDESFRKPDQSTGFGFVLEAFKAYDKMYVELVQGGVDKSLWDERVKQAMPPLVHVRDMLSRGWMKDWRLGTLGWVSFESSVWDTSIPEYPKLLENKGRYLVALDTEAETFGEYLKMLSTLAELAVLSERYLVMPEMSCEQAWAFKKAHPDHADLFFTSASEESKYTEWHCYVDFARVQNVYGKQMCITRAASHPFMLPPWARSSKPWVDHFGRNLSWANLELLGSKAGGEENTFTSEAWQQVVDAAHDKPIMAVSATSLPTIGCLTLEDNVRMKACHTDQKYAKELYEKCYDDGMKSHHECVMTRSEKWNVTNQYSAVGPRNDTVCCLKDTQQRLPNIKCP
ncbi:hypothetical protein CYMTET_56051 [Cymbomonas tetramitiformis]|uniref:Nucleotide-diphospho-sugar transferase domain-containing protein n=1 Tax=Cymbomonas tetramitiformis TaxID=36881 RepID=A0AAE0BCW3_9CHLO|nr:hypothetical protein CYMTET_56051 [Cymbomonas tetramitiformis]